MRSLSTWQANSSLLVVSLVWGLSFVMVKDAVRTVAPFVFLTLRFWLAAALLWAVYAGAARRAPLSTWLAGAATGMLLFAGFGFQTYGLQFTTSARAGFITGLSVVIVPVGSAILLRRPPGGWAVAGVALATLGLGLLSLDAAFVPGRGELLVLFCALAFAAHILALGHYAARHHPGVLAVSQITTAAVLFTAASLTLSSWPAHLTPGVWFSVAVMGLLATAGAFLVQTAVQRYTTPVSTALIFLAEPVFAALFGYRWHGDVLSARGWLGSGLILAAMALSELGGTAYGYLTSTFSLKVRKPCRYSR